MTTADRASVSHDFLVASGWGAACRRPLAGDASNRRYERLTHPGGGTAVLMDAPAERGEDLGPFLSIGRHLGHLGFSAPKVIAEHRAGGFLLLEDLGDALFAHVLDRAPEKQEELYSAAVDTLVRLHQTPPPKDVARYDADTMGDLAALTLDWYAPAPLGTRGDFARLVGELCALHAPGSDVLVLRDFHAENLLWLPDRQGVARVGLLDFQDARAGHPAYDLISLTEDARRDVPPALQEAMIARYIALTGRDPAAFRAAAAVLAAQRNLRILGVFARLCQRDGKAHYVDLIPRVWGYLQADLAHPALAPLAEAVARLLPAPTPEFLEGLKAKCGKVPTAR